jgi:hypothetical protein
MYNILYFANFSLSEVSLNALYTFFLNMCRVYCQVLRLYRIQGYITDSSLAFFFFFGRIAH